jgi:hypothetical protein
VVELRHHQVIQEHASRGEREGIGRVADGWVARAVAAAQQVELLATSVCFLELVLVFYCVVQSSIMSFLIIHETESILQDSVITP